jgi:hypothetical protein
MEPEAAWAPPLLEAAAISCCARSALRCRRCSMLPEVISTSIATHVACSSRRHCTRLVLEARVPAVVPPLPLPLPVPPKPGPLVLALPGPLGAGAAEPSEVLPAGCLRSLSSLSITPMSRSGSSCSQHGRKEGERSTEKRQVATACHFECREVKTLFPADWAPQRTAGRGQAAAARRPRLFPIWSKALSLYYTDPLIAFILKEQPSF